MYLSKTARLASLCALFLFITACEEEQSTVPTYEVSEREFKISVSAFGEIEAAEAQKIASPGNQPMILEWLAPENSIVQAGQVIARFDAQRILKDSRDEELEMLKLQQDMTKNNAIQTQQQKDIESDQTFVKHEFAFVDRFAIDDLRIYSQLEIIDTLQNRDFLEAKDDFLEWKESSIDQQHESESAVLNIRNSGHAAKYDRHQQALSKLEVVSPYSGLLIYEKDRRGEKPSVGQTVFPGRTIANIPNLDNMQARIFVLANDAIDLALEQTVNIRLDAFPDRAFSGKINNVAGFPRSIERGNPVTYYEITVTLDEQDKRLMQPGRKITAQIEVKRPEPTIVVPLQAIHHDEGKSYVYLRLDSEFSRSEVISGRKNQYVVEIMSGVTKGDVVALSIPESVAVGDQS
ncbi:efflux RND transporter periplasmic adaptor subunit [Brumicola pallidula]|jgi:multidrug efflux pump subunit AcrA (membrane-fusion protein)|uniref:Membrane fusion efflux protein, putative n=1 Tax=Brumicola pallidula DSM 14239 = ACAM 615 TaxID=1121922 RepID=K6Y9G9_9ALTE|nr:efflux RND transporter periplasmic adaptor subunit [Glaciecola pallidula]GAC29384.1 membrane fusion efflux protein, putative [Glaciecola pallidula DSM 14239 = ACAM 615]